MLNMHVPELTPENSSRGKQESDRFGTRLGFLRDQIKKEIGYIMQPRLYPGLSRRKLSKMGQIVFETTTRAERLFLFVKQIHGGGIPFAQAIESNQDFAAKFIEHQDAIYRLLELLSLNFGDRMHVCLEGFFPSKELFPDEITGLTRNADFYIETLSLPIARRVAIYQKILRKNLQEQDQNVADFKVTYVIHKLMSGSQLHAEKLLKRGQEFSGDYPSREELKKAEKDQAFQEIVQRHKSLAEEDIVTEAYLDEIREYYRNDSQARHSYITNTLSEKVPEGGIGVVVLGGGHSRYDVEPNDVAKLFRSPGFDLEDYLEHISNAKIVTFEPKHFRYLTHSYKS